MVPIINGVNAVMYRLEIEEYSMHFFIRGINGSYRSIQLVGHKIFLFTLITCVIVIDSEKKRIYVFRGILMFLYTENE